MKYKNFNQINKATMANKAREAERIAAPSNLVSISSLNPMVLA